MGKRIEFCILIGKARKKCVDSRKGLEVDKAIFESVAIQS